MYFSNELPANIFPLSSFVGGNCFRCFLDESYTKTLTPLELECFQLLLVFQLCANLASRLLALAPHSGTAMCEVSFCSANSRRENKQASFSDFETTTSTYLENTLQGEGRLLVKLWSRLWNDMSRHRHKKDI